VLTEQSACGMPVSLQVERLKRDLAAHAGDALSVREVDLYSLEGADRDAALDAVVAGEPSPFVLIDGRLVCAGAIDSEAILDSLK
jgi:hypothetical protein